jgi:phosphonate transport system substrate-binding protein
MPIQIRLLTFIFCLALAGCNYNQPDYVELDLSKAENKAPPKTIHKKELSFAVSAMYTPQETFIHYKELVVYLSDKLNIPIVFKQRKTYSEINELLEADELDFAFICTGAYQKIKKSPHIEMLCIPIIDNEPFYHAYVIVNDKSNFRKIEDLRHATFAYTDPMSNTGYDYINSLLKSKGEKPKSFFKSTVFTYGHDNSILAVAENGADGASINSLIYGYYAKFDKEKLKNIRIIHKSPNFGMPPFVVNTSLDAKTREALRIVLLNMNKDNAGKKILEQLMIDRFEIPDLKIYDEQEICH